jgi:hypothetical protein
MTIKPSVRSLPVANYNSDIARAVEWLGDRYLLAKPINPSNGGTTAALERTSPLRPEVMTHVS